MAIELINVGGLTEQTRVSYNRMLLMRAVPIFVHHSPAWAKVANVPSREGKVVNLRRLELVSAATTALTEGTPPTETQITWSAVNISISQFGAFTLLSEIVQTQAIDPQVAEIVEMYGENMGDTLDQLTRNVITVGTTQQFSGTAATRSLTSGNLTYAEIREGVATLKNNNAKKFPDGSYKGVLHPFPEGDLYADTTIQSIMQNAGARGEANPLFQGNIPRIHGVDFSVTSNARVQTSLGLSGSDIYLTIIFGQEAYGITEFSAHQARSIIKPVGSAGTSDPLDQVSSVGWKASHGAAILNQNFLLRIDHTSSLSGG